MRPLALAALVLCAALLLAACGSSGANNSATTTPQFPSGGQRPQINQQALAKLQACLKKHGVTFPSGGPQGVPPSQGQAPPGNSKFQKAMQACSQYLPSQPGGGLGG